MSIKFGPAGLGGANEAVLNLEKFKKIGLSACEVAFTYGVYLKKNDAERIGLAAKKMGIELSVHAPYWINLNSKEKEKIEASKKRILDSCEIAHYMKAKRVVFHSGYYGKDAPEESFQNIKKCILEIKDKARENKWDVEICPEIMGKKNVFGSIDEIERLKKETGCGFCIDFAHILTRYGRYDFESIKKSFPEKKWHCHFSGITYGPKGEKHHKKTPEEEWKKLFSFLKNLSKEIVIINESPSPVRDSAEGMNIWKKIKE